MPRLNRSNLVNAKAYVAAGAAFLSSLFVVLVSVVPEEGFPDFRSGALAVGAALFAALASGRLTWRVPNAPEVDEGLEAAVLEDTPVDDDLPDAEDPLADLDEDVDPEYAAPYDR